MEEKLEDLEGDLVAMVTCLEARVGRRERTSIGLS